MQQHPEEKPADAKQHNSLMVSPYNTFSITFHRKQYIKNLTTQTPSLIQTDNTQVFARTPSLRPRLHT